MPKGGGAHGTYKTTHGLDDLCLADMFQEGKECPITVRFSTVGGESGSHDCARDPRGFSVKFKTDEGNWDLVANNTPVFFVRDPANKGPNSSLKKSPPRSHPTTHKKDLYEAIERGDFPKWSLEVQTMTAKEAEDLWEKENINVFDLTHHVWPHKQFPPPQSRRANAQRKRHQLLCRNRTSRLQPRAPGSGLEPSAADPVLPIPPLLLPRRSPSPRRSKLPNNFPSTRRAPAIAWATFNATAAWPSTTKDPAPTTFPRSNPSTSKSAPSTRTKSTVTSLAPPSPSSRKSAQKTSRPRAPFGRMSSTPQPKTASSRTSPATWRIAKKDEVIKRQIAIFREVSEDLATRLEKATGIKGYPGIADLSFSGTHNGMAREKANRTANGTTGVALSHNESNGAPKRGVMLLLVKDGWG
ncbi:hypothetical protein DID88_009392 [Monilinia fructigena]|uniref:Catalase core domain-containing protein n=1 Tax=Monilinia fructigena TaxID=38457 RepID=A0A395IPY7_9HELO|nr:hypothetical protein DID88_009392 [Monilinia fructigena]